VSSFVSEYHERGRRGETSRIVFEMERPKLMPRVTDVPVVWMTNYCFYKQQHFYCTRSDGGLLRWGFWGGETVGTVAMTVVMVLLGEIEVGRMGSSSAASSRTNHGSRRSSIWESLLMSRLNLKCTMAKTKIVLCSLSTPLLCQPVSFFLSLTDSQ